MNSLLDNPLLARLQTEAADFHLVQTGVIIRHKINTVNGRDLDGVETIYIGRMGVKREKLSAQAAQQITLELPYTVVDVKPGDVVHMDAADDREYPLFIVEEFTPTTEARVLAKARCSTRVSTPKE